LIKNEEIGGGWTYNKNGHPKHIMKKLGDGHMIKMDIQNVYIDTCFFQGYLWGKKDEEENASDMFSKIETSVRQNPNINVKIPFIVVGELINNLIRENVEQGNREEIMYKLFELQKNLKADTIPPNKSMASFWG
jgi:uncharacterized protein YejL (UPF0352 family)